MIQKGPRDRRSRRRGITLVEIIVAGMLAALLGILLAEACATFGRPALEVDARARISREAILAAQSLACDLGGSLADSAGRTGAVTDYQINWPYLTSPSDVLLLTFTGSTSSPGSVTISYYLIENQLVRYDSSTGATTTIANYVTGFIVEPVNTSNIQITFTIAFRYFTATYTLIGVAPSS